MMDNNHKDIKKNSYFLYPTGFVYRGGRGGEIRLRWWSRNDLTIDGCQLVALVSVHGRCLSIVLDVDGLLHLALHPVLFSVGGYKMAISHEWGKPLCFYSCIFMCI